MNVMVLEALFADPTAYEIVEEQGEKQAVSAILAKPARRPLSTALVYAPARD
jgi:hypothetical protein